MNHDTEMLTDQGAFILLAQQCILMCSGLVFQKRLHSCAEMRHKLRANGLEPMRTISPVFASFPLMALLRLLDRFNPGTHDNDAAQSDRVAFSGPINWLSDKVMRFDEWLRIQHLSLPLGGTLVVVAPKSTDSGQY